MNRKTLLVAALLATASLAAIVASIATAEDPMDAKTAAPAGPAEMPLPPGWTKADMEACMMAATPGDQHKRLVAEAGVWQGKTTMWMVPGAEPMQSQCTSTITPIMDGRYTKCEMAGDMPGMGPYNGFGIYGFDNVSQKYVSTWIDNHSTGIMTGMGEASADGKTLTWKFTYNCPITKKPVVMREVETNTGPNTKTLEMFGPDPKTGKEFKMMRIELTKQSGGTGG
ncbi:MAG: DUF1579 domain-containing protein [Phycisphaeraceae bacterium]